MKILGFFLSIFLLLVACGDNSSNSSSTGNVIVSSLSDLPPCEIDNEGEQIFVKEESAIRVCSDGKWFATMASEEPASVSCTTEPLKDKSGVKIICDGDSVGEVKNGTPGVDGKNCSVAQSAAGKVTVTCGEKSVTIDISTKEVPVEKDPEDEEPVVLDPEQVATKIDTVKGFSQKGPYLMGAKVTVRGLENGTTLSQTSYTSEGKIANNKGEFKIHGGIFPSQYVSLTAEGQYRNEVSGKVEDVELRLSAISDLSARSTVNINILTHLEYDRVYYKVKTENKRVKIAKKETSKEIFDLFHIDATNFSNSEDLNIVGGSAEDGALLAVSVLMQRNQGVAALSEQLSKISMAIEKTGKWDDEAAKLQIADWAMGADTLGQLEKIRGHVVAWGLSETVPNFENYVRNYWRVEYGLGKCGNPDSVAVGTVAAPKRGGVAETVRFICADVEGTVRWRLATELEKNTYKWEPGYDGQKEPGSVNTDLYYIFDGTTSSWRQAKDELEKALGGCVENRKGEFFKVGGEWYTCEDRQWKNTKNIVVDIVGWIPGSDGTIEKGDRTDDYYTYDEAEAQWRTASTLDVELGFNGCTTKRTGVMVKVVDPQNPHLGNFYICRSNHEWEQVINPIAINTYGYVCDVEGKMVSGKNNSQEWFVCENDDWREATTTEEARKRACLSSMVDEIFEVNGTDYICRSKNEWDIPKFYDYPAGTEKFFSTKSTAHYVDTLYIDRRDGKKYKLVKIQIGDYQKTWFAENLRFRNYKLSSYESLEGQVSCLKEINGDCSVGGAFYTWAGAMNIPSKWNEGLASDNAGLIQSPHQGVCPTGWHVPTGEEWKLLLSVAGADINNVDVNISYSVLSTGFDAWPNATDEYGFSVLPTGVIIDSKREGLNEWSSIWSASDPVSYMASCGRLYSSSMQVSNCSKNAYYPVRCVED